MHVVGIAVSIPVPAGLHTNRIRVESRDVHIAQWAIAPKASDIAIRSLFELVILADVYVKMRLA